MATQLFQSCVFENESMFPRVAKAQPWAGISERFQRCSSHLPFHILPTTLYDRLLRIQPSPVVQLNRAVAIAMCEGPEAGLRHIDAVLEHGELANYYLAHSARADMYRRLGRTAEARSSYEKALALTQQEPERQFLQERIRQLK
jgi:predicted RNA polymerase sigma factor